jgi:hypothetical protein
MSVEHEQLFISHGRATEPCDKFREAKFIDQPLRHEPANEPSATAKHVPPDISPIKVPTWHEPLQKLIQPPNRG